MTPVEELVLFTGLVETRGTVVATESRAAAMRLAISAPSFFDRAAIGDSVSVNGCCLTLVAVDSDRGTFDVGPESLKCTTAGTLGAGCQVNLERATLAGSPLGGHFVTGHVDAVGRLTRRSDLGEWSEMWFRVPDACSRQIARKGCIAVDGVSLTLVDVNSDSFSAAIIPHTLAVTTLGRLKVGDVVNVETDLLAKYVERQLAAAGTIHPGEVNSPPKT